MSEQTEQLAVEEQGLEEQAVKESKPEIAEQVVQKSTQELESVTKRYRNKIMQILLAAILVMQVICSVQLFMVLRTGNKIMDAFEANRLVANGAQGAGSDSIIEKKEDMDVTESGTVQENVSAKNEMPEESISKEDAWKLVLVNKWNKMEEGYVPELTEYAEGHRVDARIEDSLRNMIKGAKKAGYAIYLLSAYRDVEKQTDLYQAEIAKWKAKGYSAKDAEQQAGTIVAVPGTSEHHLGLAVDLVSSEHVKLDAGAEKTNGYKWLVAHCHEYGFILRYPNGATEITGIIYEPWHFRYVGVEAATEIMENGITLEEYLDSLEK